MATSNATATNFIDYYQVLGLEAEWDIDTIRKKLLEAFRGTKARVNAASGRKLDQINQRLNWIAEARKILLDPDAKAKYDQDLAEWKRTATSEEKAAAAAIPTLEELWRLIDEGRYVDAVEGGKRLVGHTPDDYQAWEVYAKANFYWYDYNTAIEAAQEAIRCNPQKAELYADAGEYLVAAKRWAEAFIFFNRAIQLEPNNSGYKLALANIHMEHQSWGEAETIVRGVLSQEPSNKTARTFMAILITYKAEARFPEVNQLLSDGKRSKARKILKELQEKFDEAQKLAEHEPDLKDLLNTNSIAVRQVLGVNFYRRLFALAIDFSPIFLILTFASENETAVYWGFPIAFLMLGYSWIWLAYKNRGQDLTKRLLGMQIVCDDTSTPGRISLIFRAILKPLAFYLVYLFSALFIAWIILLSGLESLGDEARFIGGFVGLIITLPIIAFRFGFDLFFVTSKDYMPNLLGWLLFSHEHLTKTIVINSTNDDCRNFKEYHWF